MLYQIIKVEDKPYKYEINIQGIPPIYCSTDEDTIDSLKAIIYRFIAKKDEVDENDDIYKEIEVEITQQ